MNNVMVTGLYSKDNSLIINGTEIANSNTNKEGLAASGSQLYYNGAMLQDAAGNKGIYLSNDALVFNGQDVSFVDKLNVTLDEFSTIFSKQTYNTKKPYYITSGEGDIIEYANTSNNNGKVEIDTDVYQNIETNIPSYGETCFVKRYSTILPDTAYIQLWLNDYALNGSTQTAQLSGSGLNIDKNVISFDTNDFYVPHTSMVVYERENTSQEETKTINVSFNGITEQLVLRYPQAFYMYKKGWVGSYSADSSTNVTEGSDSLLMYSNSSLSVSFIGNTKHRLVVFIKVINTLPANETVINIESTLRLSSSSDSSVSRMIKEHGFGYKSVDYQRYNGGGDTELTATITHSGGLLEIEEIGVMIW